MVGIHKLVCYFCGSENSSRFARRHHEREHSENAYPVEAMNIQRFWQKVNPASALECWIWNANMHYKGYGLFGRDGKTESCDLEVCHNDGDSSNNHVSNLRWDTHSSNQWDQVAHGKHSNASRTHCRRGHPLSGLNLIEASSGNGHRNCRTCRKASDYFRYHKTPPSESAAVYEEIYNRVINGINLRPRRG